MTQILHASGQGHEYRVNGLRPKIYDNGLNSNFVYSIIQDDYGLLWFGTLNGLNTFDKHVFNEYLTSSGYMKCKINCLSVARDSLFVGTDNGLSIIDLNTSAITNVYCDNAWGLSMMGEIITKISSPNNGLVLFGTNKGVFSYDLVSKMFEPIMFNELQNYFSVNDIIFNDIDSVWMIASNKGLIVYDDINNDVECYTLNDTLDIAINTILHYDGNTFFVGTDIGLYEFDYKCGTYDNISLVAEREPVITKIIIVDNDLLIGTKGNGLFKYNLHALDKEDIVDKNVYENILSDNFIIDLYCDNCGVVWIATSGGLGTLSVDNKAVSIHKYYSQGTKLQPVWCIEEIADPKYFIGTDVGVLVFDRINGSFTLLGDYFGMDYQPLQSYRMSTLFFDENRYLWIGTCDNGLYCFDTNRKKCFNITEDFNVKELAGATVYEIVRGVGNTLWVASNKGIFLLNLDNKTVKSYVHDPSDSFSLPSNIVMDLLWDNGVLYISTSDGLSLYSPGNDKFITYRLEETQEHDMATNFLFKISKRSDGNLYIGSYINGIIVFDIENKQFVLQNDSLELNAPLVFSIIFDEDNNVWANTNNGMIRYDMEYGVIMNMSDNIDFKGTEFVPNAAEQSSNGYIFYGGINGFNVFNPFKVKVDATNPEVIITDFATKKKNYISRIHNGDTITLPDINNSFNVSFAAINIDKVNTVKYKFKLVDYDKDWVVRDVKKRYAEYKELPAGTYTFLLTASGESKQWNSEVFKLVVQILPQWHSTIWFRIDVVLIILVLFLLIVFYRKEKIRQRIMYQQELDNLEKMIKKLTFKSLQLQINPHSLFNILNSIQSYILANDTKSASIYLSGFAKLMRRLLTVSHEQLVTLFEELESIRLYLELESMRMKNRFTFSIEVDDDIDIRDVDVMPLLLQPFVENAVIHGLAHKEGPGFLKIEIHRVNKSKLLCVIEDNGIGRKKAAELNNMFLKRHRSYGIEITKQRLELMKTINDEDYFVNIIDLYDDDGNAAGTRVEVMINIVE